MEARYVKVASRFFLAGNAGNAGDGSGGHGHHFLDACFLCKREITSDRHIFMCKGDAAFCGDECRQDQRAMDAVLKAARRRHRSLLRSASLPAPATGSAPVGMPRRPTIAGLASATPSCPAS
ncbi:hypothetical protein C2845_PM10G00280 [Panicum miliaceum]|uniref:FLZ-type domain-containing protein n=1 Tax=Panicum miliaceum TaxID=4540 RepID=A0A3L6PBK4_PANMI|nr:hypothetical protein C2845_PM10G00280 [Panicum miliaceum]